MNSLEKHPLVMIAVGVAGISLSAIFVKYSNAPSVVTAAYRLIWTIMLMTPFVMGNKQTRQEILKTDKKTVAWCAVSGIFLALHFTFWFESLNWTSVASSTAITCTEVIWVALGVCLFLKGSISKAALGSITVTILGSLLIAFSDYSATGHHLRGDALALAAAIFTAVCTLIGREIRKNMSTAGYTYIVYFFCALVLCLVTLGSGLPLWGYGIRPLIVSFLLAVFSTLLGHSIFTWCLKFLSPAFVSASKLCEPAVAALFAASLFGELPTPMQIIGGIVTIGGVLIYSRIEITLPINKPLSSL